MERWTTVEILPINSRKKYCLRGHQIKFWIQTVCSWLYERTCHLLAKRTSALEELLVKEPAEGIRRTRSAITRKITANHLTELEAASSLHINFLKCVGLRLRYTAGWLKENISLLHWLLLTESWEEESQVHNDTGPASPESTQLLLRSADATVHTTRNESWMTSRKPSPGLRSSCYWVATPSPNIEIQPSQHRIYKTQYLVTCLQVHEHNSHIEFLLPLIFSHPLYVNFLAKKKKVRNKNILAQGKTNSSTLLDLQSLHCMSWFPSKLLLKVGMATRIYRKR